MKAYEIITNHIINKLEKGQVPWQKPWSNKVGLPKNLISKKLYKGINILLLAMSSFNSPYWLTYKQAKQLGGNVKKGEKGTPVVFWNFKVVKDTKVVDNEEQEIKKKIGFMRYYTVFNLEQCENINSKKIPEDKQPQTFDFNPINQCESIVKNMLNKPIIKNQGSRACYIPSNDEINIPESQYFKTAQEYYSTLFHELAHSTGHESRLNRKTLTELCPFGSTNYSKEELIAEITAAFICGYAGIETVTIDNSIAYLQGWVKKFQEKPKMIIMASQQAQKAANYMLNIKEQKEVK